ncbi:uncharacterized protein BHQ10_000535 [Talaromyces amestolkiae]|uniref:RTA1 domain protein n=1 Tax=Talaromyces amestolkiae TaxID=1196081 RepID=A0A364KLW0_TALAM|nr:uncharacterized protein BHQ10_000535 [Talaromyces amestolkiae]RAO64523.1 hypothetical protein BHQ10_000535 [Talaromyces amestolkiae]
MSNATPVTFNATLYNNTDLCTLDTCPLDWAQVDYVPSLPGNLIYVAIFGLALLLQIAFGVYYKTWTYMIAMIGGLVGEIIGYIGRVQMHYNPFPQTPFLEYLVCLTIAPAFLSAAIYLCFSRIVIVYGGRISRFRPKTYTYLFIAGDFIALLLQAAGGGIAASASGSTQQTGINIMIAGVSWQVFSLAVFAALCMDFALRVRRTQSVDLNPQYDALRISRSFKIFLWSLGIATLTIFVRSVFRCAELSGGFNGSLANNEVTFMVLEGAMISIAVIALTSFHPGLIWKREWRELARSMRARKDGKDYQAGALMSASDADRESGYQMR